MHGTSTRGSGASMAQADALLGAAGLFILNLVFGPLAIGLGTAVIRRGVRPGLPWVTVLASVVLGAADLVVRLAWRLGA